MNEDLFLEIKRILSEGGKLVIKNRKGVELDITFDYKVAIAVVERNEEALKNESENKKSKMNEMIKELAFLKLELNKLRDIKKIRDDYMIRKDIYENSDEGRLIKKVVNSNIKDVGAIVKSYGNKPLGQEIIYDKYENILNEKLAKQREDDGLGLQLDNLVDFYREKFKP